MSSSGGGSRVSIPSSVRKTIEDIREITGKQHSDEDIYAVLKDCSMDPNETAQKLLYLDTFHEVKKKRDRIKENSNNRAPEDSRLMPSTQGRRAWGGRERYSSNDVSFDAGGGRNAAPRRGNGIHITQRGSLPSLPVPQKTKNNSVPHVTKASSAVPSGPSILANGSSSHGRGPHLSVGGVKHETEDSSAVDVNNRSTPTQTFSCEIQVEQENSASSSTHLLTSATLASVPGVYFSASDPALAPPLSPHLDAVGTIKRGVGSQQKAAEGNKHAFHDGDLELLKSEKGTSGALNSMQKRKALRKSKAVEKTQLSESVQASSSTHDGSLPIRSSSNYDSPPKVFTSEVSTITVKVNSQMLPESNVPDGQHVTFPNHFQVPEALKNGLTFGSFDANFEIGIKYSHGTSGDNNAVHAVESSQGGDEITGEPSPSSQSVSSTAQSNNLDHPQSPPLVLEKVLSSNGNISSGADLNGDQLKEEMLLLPDGQQKPTVQNVPNFGLGFTSPLPDSHPVQYEGSETQNEDSPALTSSSPTPPVQNSISATPHPIPVFRQPYPPNYFPYGHFLPPFFMPPMHQFLTPNGLPQQPSNGNVYLPPAAAAPGVKFPLPQFKQGTNTGNTTLIGIPPGYGSYGSSPVGFNPVPAVTSGSSTNNEDLDASKLKENYVYTTGQLSEGSAVWIPAPGQDLSNLQVNSLYNLALHGQHFAFSPAQAGHGVFAGIYQPPQKMAATSNVNPLMQQSLAMAAAIENVGPASTAYQQPQRSQINWNTSY